MNTANTSLSRTEPLKTRVVTFSYGTVKNASLKIPAEPCSIVDIVSLIRQSYLEYMFRPGCGLMADECLVSSIGRSNFFAGALGGFESRLDAETFRHVKDYAMDDIGMALAVVCYRNPSLSLAEAYKLASGNEALSEDARKTLALIAEMKV